jgi:pimeloyl-ACP methyl ester carboxylesterase
MSSLSDGDIPVVLYCHSPGGAPFEIKMVSAAAAAAGVRVIAFDRAELGSPALSVIDVARDVLDFVDAELPARFGVAAWSGGAPYALGVAFLDPQRVGAVALACPIPRWLRGDGAMEPASERLRAIRDGEVPAPLAAELDIVSNPWGFAPEAVAARVTILHGDDDEIIPLAVVAEFAQSLPDATLTVIEGEGHRLVFSRWAALLQSAAVG